jgi:hypothetical protein
MRKSAPKKTFSFGTNRLYGDCAEYAEKGYVLDFVAIDFEPGRGYDGADRWAVTVKVQGRDPEVLSLTDNPKRAEQLRAAQAYLKRGGKITNKRLRLIGNAFYFTDAEDGAE